MVSCLYIGYARFAAEFCTGLRLMAQEGGRVCWMDEEREGLDWQRGKNKRDGVRGLWC